MTGHWHATVCPHDCPSVCALEVEKTADGRLGKVKGSTRNSYTAGVICAKGNRHAERYHHQDRLTFPMRRIGPRGSGQFTRIDWDEALDRVAEGLASAAAAASSHSHQRRAISRSRTISAKGLPSRRLIERSCATASAWVASQAIW